jgi:hypothetical protein
MPDPLLKSQPRPEVKSGPVGRVADSRIVGGHCNPPHPSNGLRKRRFARAAASDTKLTLHSALTVSVPRARLSFGDHWESAPGRIRTCGPRIRSSVSPWAVRSIRLNEAVSGSVRSPEICSFRDTGFDGKPYTRIARLKMPCMITSVLLIVRALSPPSANSSARQPSIRSLSIASIGSSPNSGTSRTSMVLR